jgi:hypothetical protein
MRPFVDFVPKPPVDLDLNGSAVQIDNILMLLPEPIPNPHTRKYLSMCAQCLLTEVEKLNDILRFLTRNLAAATANIKHDDFSPDTKLFLEGKVPPSWKRFSGYDCSDQTSKFTTYLIQKHAFLLSWFRDGRPKVIDVGVLDDLCAFMFAFMIDTAIAREIAVDELTYEFSFIEPSAEILDHGFGLKNLYLLSGADHVV